MVNILTISFRLTLAKYFVVIMLVLFNVSNLFSQEVSNVIFRQDGNNIIVNYDLTVDGTVEVKLYCSTDGGLNFGTSLDNLSGDIGTGVYFGTNNEIVWNVLASQKYLSGENIVFKVEANKSFIKMVYVEGGSFQMGNNSGKINESPIHEVILIDFYIGKFEVTQKQWEKVMDYNPSYRKKSDKLPVERVSFEDISLFLLKLNQRTGENYRLPTEAEWEYAAKGGQNEKNTIYSGSNNNDRVSWDISNSTVDTYVVGCKEPNELGIFDMSGNVWEICSDYYDPKYYSNSVRHNPKGPNTGSHVVKRGGATFSVRNNCTVTNRGKIAKDQKNGNTGFRIVKEIQ